MRWLIKFLMEVPLFYRIVQGTLAFFGHRTIKDYLIQNIPSRAKKILDQGCGTGEYSLLFPGRYTGLDNNRKDIKYAAKRYSGNFVFGSADKMPFKGGEFDLTFAVGLHHHLPNNLARRAIKESLRVTKSGGKIIVIDAMYPRNKLNLIGFFLRKIDRGRFVRIAKSTVGLLPPKSNYQVAYLSGFPLDYIVVTIKKN